MPVKTVKGNLQSLHRLQRGGYKEYDHDYFQSPSVIAIPHEIIQKLRTDEPTAIDLETILLGRKVFLGEALPRRIR